MHVSDLNHPNAELQRKLEYIYSLRTGSKVNWNSESYLRLLDKLGNPHENLPPVIHVAGTNGKGSVVAMLRAVFEASGYRVHTYTSPHLLRVNERIVLAGNEIRDAQLHDVLDEILVACEGASLSFFEIMTAAAFLMFSRISGDVLLLEVGMGGKLDCTNVIPRPLVSIINRISMDHTEFLGGSIAEIAAQKAGIIKSGVPCVLGYQGGERESEDIAHVVKSVAENFGSPLSLYGRDWDVQKSKEGFVFSSRGAKTEYPLPALLGVHQIYNAGLVIAALSFLHGHYTISYEHICAGLWNAQWRGRLQRLPSESFGDSQELFEFWLDCGHNDSAGEALAQQAMIWRQDDQKNLILVVAMLGKKDFLSFIRPILPHCSVVYCIGIVQEPSALDPQSAFYQIESLGFDIPVYVQKDIQHASAHILSHQNKGSRVLIAGSVYLAGEVLKYTKE